MSGYENGKIYKVVDENDNIIYVGSTKTSLNERWQKHNLYCNQYKIVLIENYPCENRTELRKMEQKFINIYIEMGLLNERKAYRTKEELKKELKKYNKEYKKSDKYKEYKKSDKRKEYTKQYEKSDKRKNYQKEYHKKKEKCPFCDKILVKTYIKNHIKNSCKNKENF